MRLKKGVLDGEIILIGNVYEQVFTGVSEADLYLVEKNIKDINYANKILSKYPTFKRLVINKK